MAEVCTLKRAVSEHQPSNGGGDGEDLQGQRQRRASKEALEGEATMPYVPSCVCMQSR